GSITRPHRRRSTRNRVERRRFCLCGAAHTDLRHFQNCSTVVLCVVFTSFGAAGRSSYERNPIRLPAWSKAFGVQVTIALIAGVILGLIARSWGPISQAQDNWLGTTLDTIGSSYVTLLKAAVVPL